MLVDISARAPYGLKVGYSTKDNPDVLDKVADVIGIDARFGMIKMQDDHGVLYGLEPSESIKPMLRPMSSMTEEEKNEFEELGWRVDELDDNFPWPHSTLNVIEGIEWLHKHHLNYRLPKHLFIEVTDENNPYKNEVI